MSFFSWLFSSSNCLILESLSEVSARIICTTAYSRAFSTSGSDGTAVADMFSNSGFKLDTIDIMVCLHNQQIIYLFLLY